MPAPRTVTPPDEELIKLGEEMLEWVIKNKPMHLSQWYSLEKAIIYNDWKAYIQKPAFLPYYERSLLSIGLQYLDKNSNIREGVSQRWQRVYFKDLKEMEDEQVVHKAQAAKKQEEETQDDLARRLVNAIKDSEKVSRTEKTRGPDVEAE